MAAQPNIEVKVDDRFEDSRRTGEVVEIKDGRAKIEWTRKGDHTTSWCSLRRLATHAHRVPAAPSLAAEIRVLAEKLETAPACLELSPDALAAELRSIVERHTDGKAVAREAQRSAR